MILSKSNLLIKKGNIVYRKRITGSQRKLPATHRVDNLSLSVTNGALVVLNCCLEDALINLGYSYSTYFVYWPIGPS